MMLNRLCGGSDKPIDNTNGYLAVGSGNIIGDNKRTALVQEVGRKKLDTGYPSLVITAGNITVTYRSTFQASEGNGSWKEWGLFNASTSGVMLNRVVADNGTKVSGQTWVLTVTITYRRT